MDFAKSFSYITEDQDWVKKFGIAAILWLFVVGIFAVVGWALEIARRVATQQEPPLPAWDNIGEFFVNGFKVWLVSILWSIPIVVIAVLVFAPLIFLQDTDDDWAATAMVLANLCFFLIVIIYSIILNILSIPMALQIAEGKSIGEVVNPAGAFQLLRANPGGYIIATLVGLLLTSVLSTLGLLVCLVGTGAGAAFSVAVSAHLVGQAHGQAKQTLATAPHPV